ncbi:hypothetical protein TSUD_87870 [Trifolium subterraneum]|uniref:RNA polymerase subunit H/Rpb5 C-terminal domain-containing protein n=1 Tax=Trifolium subterraneum TaxID=3900 RepID=A0A2Z6NN31_TRISU|nr:hypothetical protein TSUD_87870 [Trifolium subterraneum]
MSKHEFKEKYGKDMKREDLIINKSKKDKPSDQIYVFFLDEFEVSINVLRTCTNRKKSENVYRAILVCQSSLTDASRNFIVFKIAFFRRHNWFNIKDHVLVPEHKVLTDTEKKTLLGEGSYIARYDGLNHGEVVQIIRLSEIARRYVTSRYVTSRYVT